MATISLLAYLLVTSLAQVGSPLLSLHFLVFVVVDICMCHLLCPGSTFLCAMNFCKIKSFHHHQFIFAVQTSTVFVFANCLGLFSNQVGFITSIHRLLTNPSQSSMAIRSLMSKLVPATDLGKIYATMGALENLVPLAVSPGFTLLYNHSLETWPGLVSISISITLYLCTYFVTV